MSDVGEIMMCGAFEPSPGYREPFRCTAPYGHEREGKPHYAAIDGRVVAKWDLGPTPPEPTP